MNQLAVLILSLVLTFAQLGTPLDTPLISPEEAKERGQKVSEIAQNNNPASAHTESSENVPDEHNTNEGSSSQSAHEAPDTQRIATVNNRAEKNMPTSIPQVAVDNSPALDEASDENTPSNFQENEQAQSQESQSDNAAFGQTVAASNPESAQEDGHAFGQETSESAKENSRRP